MKLSGARLVEQELDDALTGAFELIRSAINLGTATDEEALDVMRHWGLEEAWEDFAS